MTSRSKAGYILVETVVAMVVLSIGIMTIQSSLRQIIIASGQARDYTQARFLLEELVEKLLFEPEFTVEETDNHAKPANTRVTRCLLIMILATCSKNESGVNIFNFENIV